MPQVEITPENKGQSVYEYPKFSLDKGERARVLAIEKAPMMEYVHTLRAPKMVGGRVAMETVDNFGKEQDQPVYNFLGRPLCLGDLGVLKDKGSDPEQCPACAVAAESDAIQAPQRRFAMHVVHYATQPGGFGLQEPFSVKLEVWQFTDQIFNKLIEFTQEWGSLREHDLLCGPCESKQWQRFDIQISQKAEWLGSEERKKHVATLYDENKAKDLSALIARKISREQMTEDVRKVRVANQMAFGRGAASAEETVTEMATSADLDSLLDPKEVTAESAQTAVEEPQVDTEASTGDMDLKSILDDLGE